MTNERRASAYEAHLIPRSRWETIEPPVAATAAISELKSEGVPVGLAHHPRYGWAVLTTGQGPLVVWSEGDEDE